MTQKTLFYPTHYQKGKSKHDGKPYIKITMVEFATAREYYTYVYSSCKNKTQWDLVLELKHRDIAIEFDPLIIKDERRGIIDGDSIPVVESVYERGELKQALADYWREEKLADKPREPAKPEGQFGKLFEIIEDTK